MIHYSNPVTCAWNDFSMSPEQRLPWNLSHFSVALKSIFPFFLTHTKPTPRGRGTSLLFTAGTTRCLCKERLQTLCLLPIHLWQGLRGPQPAVLMFPSRALCPSPCSVDVPLEGSVSLSLQLRRSPGGLRVPLPAARTFPWRAPCPSPCSADVPLEGCVSLSLQLWRSPGGLRQLWNRIMKDCQVGQIIINK